MVTSVFFADTVNGWIVGVDSDFWQGLVYRTTNGGLYWSTQIIGDKQLISVHFINQFTGWIVGESGTLLKTTNSGENWFNLSPGTNQHLLDLFFVDQFIGWVVGDSGLVIKTTDGGISWETQESQLEYALRSVYFINENVGWAAGYEGKIIRTTDGGANWQSHLTDATVIISISFVDENDGWAVGSDWNNFTAKLIRTSNGGINWLDQHIGTNNGLNSIHFIDASTGWVAGQGGTIMKTTNAGIPVEIISFTVSVFSNGIELCWMTATETNNQGFKIERKSKDNNFETIGFVSGNGTSTEPKSYSFTDRNVEPGVYQYRLKQVDFDGSFTYSDIIEVEVDAPIEFSLEQNYPNPFNPSTTIRYQVPERSFITLKVYDILGNEIATLVTEEKPAGSYEVEFNSHSGLSGIKELPSGIYFYKLQAGNFVQTKKMILLK